MNKFEMTERGKIVIAIILVTVLLVIPTIIILISVSSCSRADQLGIQMAFVQPDELLDDELLLTEESTPLPDIGIVFSPTSINTGTQGASVQKAETDPEDSTAITPSSTQSGTGNENDEVEAEPGPTGLNIGEGTMSFLFFPDEQSAFDAATLTSFREFLTSSKNTSDSLIRVQVPNISDADEQIFMSALLSAFSANNLSESRLLLVKSSSRITESHFEASLSYTVPNTSQK